MPDERHLIAVLEDLLDLRPGSATGDTRLRDLADWDSVNALKVLVYLEDRLGHPVDFEAFTAADTLGDLAAVAFAGPASGGPRVR